jgi:hypothetical protein
VFMCYVWFWKWSAIISSKIISKVISVKET